MDIYMSGGIGLADNTGALELKVVRKLVARLRGRIIDVHGGFGVLLRYASLPALSFTPVLEAGGGCGQRRREIEEEGRGSAEAGAVTGW
jgi:hypothetical protein